MIISKILNINKNIIYHNINIIIISLFLLSFIFSFFIFYLSPNYLTRLIREENFIELSSGLLWLVSSIILFLTATKFRERKIYNLFLGIISLIAFSEEMSFITIITEKITNKQFTIPKFISIVYFFESFESKFLKQIWITFLIIILLLFSLKNNRNKFKFLLSNIIKKISRRFYLKVFFASITFIVIAFLIDYNFLDLKGNIYYMSTLIEETLEFSASILIFILALYSYDKLRLSL